MCHAVEMYGGGREGHAPVSRRGARADGMAESLMSGRRLEKETRAMAGSLRPCHSEAVVSHQGS